MVKITVTKDLFPTLFGGIGFHNNEAALYKVMDQEHFNQVICKIYREISPGYMRTFAGFSDWTIEAMNDFAEYYEKMQKWTDKHMYICGHKGKIHFSDDEIKQYAEDVAENLNYLINQKGVKHIRYYCFTNEMSHCGWGVLMENLPLFKKYHEMLYRSFAKRKLNIGLLATDASGFENWGTMDWAIQNMSQITEDYCLHIYENEHDIYDHDYYYFFYDKCKEVVDKALRDDGKRVILGEYGVTKGANVQYGQGIIRDICSYFYSGESAHAALMLSEMAFAAINAGIFMIGLWSFTDYPDPYSCAHAETGYAKKWGEAEPFVSLTTDVKYNKWGMTKWEDNGDYSARPHYWCIGLLVKYFKRNSKVLTLSCNDRNIRMCGILNKDGSISIGIINRNKQNTKVQIDIGVPVEKKLRVYEFDSNNVPENPFCDLQNYSSIVKVIDSIITYELLAESMTIFTTDYIERDYPVYATGVTVDANNLVWDEINDHNHCYYRVYASNERDFVPSPSNQIASTVATHLPNINKNLSCYKVLSVDKSGNCYKC